MASSVSVGTRSKLDSLREICDMEEMKKDTIITKGVLVTARYVLSTQKEDGKEFIKLLDKMKNSFQVMLSSVKEIQAAYYQKRKTVDFAVSQIFSH